MDPRQAKSIFLHAVENEAAADWASYLDKACGDDSDLRNAVESLLNAHQEGVDLTDGARQAFGSAIATIDQPITEKPGAQIGAFKLLQQIGEGGMGTVFMAEQKKPVKRRVALKVIKPGMDTRQVIARFEAERQALAMMDHPNIARVLDAGSTESGRPFFVMELVNGSPITQYCDEKKLSLRERLKLFLPVCRAVQHAHQKGIIHRDLKPSNILVASYDGRPVPKVIDFGVARAANQSLTEKTLFTEFGQIVGTLDYMSPEQAERNQLDIDTRSDVYSLGVVLYELLVGETPFDRKRLRSAAWEEMLRIIREEEPPRPSIRLSSSGTAPSIAANRSLDPAKLGTLMRGELDWIVMKALEKDRSRRFETANQFAEDIEHYLSDEPVQACPPSTGYRLRKFVRRNRAKLLASVLVLAASLILIGGVGWAIRDRTAREQKIAREELERNSRITSEVETVLEEVTRLETPQDWSSAMAEARRAQSLLANGDVRPELEQRVNDQVRLLTLLRQLDEARAGSVRLTKAGYDHAGADRAYRAAFLTYGIDLETLSVDEASDRLSGGPEASTYIASSLLDWIRHRRSLLNHQSPDSLDLHLLSLADRIDRDPWRVRLRGLMREEKTTRNTGFKELARTAKTNELPPQTLETLAGGLHDDVSLDAAIRFLRKAQDAHPNDFWLAFTLGRYLHDLRARWHEQEMYFRIAAALRPDSSSVRNYLGIIFHHLGNEEQMIASYRKAMELNSTNSAARTNLAEILATTSASDLRAPDLAMSLAQEVTKTNPQSYNAWQTLAVAAYANEDWNEYLRARDRTIQLGLRGQERLYPDYINRARAYAEVGEKRKALREYSRAALRQKKHGERDRVEKLLDIRATERDQLYLQAYADPSPIDATETYWTKRADLHYSLGSYEQALAASDQAIAINPTHYAHVVRANSLVGLGRSEEALAASDIAVSTSPLSCIAFLARANALFSLGRTRDAMEDWKTAVLNHPELMWVWNALGRACEQNDQWNVVEETFRALPEFSKHGEANYWLNCSRLLANHKQWKMYRRFCAFVVEQAGDTNSPQAASNILTCLNRIPDAVDDWTQPKRLAELLLSSDRKDRFMVASMLYLRAGEHQKAIELARQAMKDPEVSGGWLRLATTLVAEKASDEYRVFCNMLLNYVDQTEDPEVASQLLLCLVVGPEAVEDWSRAQRIADLVLEGTDEFSRPLVAMFYMRSGEFQRASRLLEQAMNSSDATSYDYLVLALAQAQRKKVAEAQKLVSQAERYSQDHPEIINHPVYAMLRAEVDKAMKAVARKAE